MFQFYRLSFFVQHTLRKLRIVFSSFLEIIFVKHGNDFSFAKTDNQFSFFVFLAFRNMIMEVFFFLNAKIHLFRKLQSFCFPTTPLRVHFQSIHFFFLFLILKYLSNHSLYSLCPFSLFIHWVISLVP